jgi:hypothetical protein
MLLQETLQLREYSNKNLIPIGKMKKTKSKKPRLLLEFMLR